MNGSEDEIFGDFCVEGQGVTLLLGVAWTAQNLLACSRSFAFLVDHSAVVAVTETMWPSVRSSVMSLCCNMSYRKPANMRNNKQVQLLIRLLFVRGARKWENVTFDGGMCWYFWHCLCSWEYYTNPHTGPVSARTTYATLFSSL